MRKERIRATRAKWSPVDDLPSHSLAHGPQPRSIFMPQDAEARPGVLRNVFALAAIVMNLHNDGGRFLPGRAGALFSRGDNRRGNNRRNRFGNGGVWTELAGKRPVRARLASPATVRR